MKPFVKIVIGGCGCLALLGVATVLGLGAWLFTSPEGGVKLGNEMDTYALEYIEQHGLLEQGEEILAYYDVTISMDGTEAALLTPRRVLYHKDGANTSISLEEITDIRHRKESLVGDVIEIESSTGQTMKIEIAPLNQGETFKNVLMRAWESTHEESS